MPCIFVAYDLSVSSKLAPHPRLTTMRIARLELGLLLMFRHNHAQESAAHSFSRMEEELAVPSPPAPGVARQLLPDTVDIERRMYETMPKSDLTAGMVKGEDGRTRFKIIDFWRAMGPRYPLLEYTCCTCISCLLGLADRSQLRACVQSRRQQHDSSAAQHETQDTVRIGDGGLLLEQPQ